MPKTYLTTSTNPREEPSVGASPKNYMMPFLQNQSVTTATPQGRQLGLSGLQWSLVDEGTNGKVRFLNTVEITGRREADIPQIALYRIACYLLLSYFDEKSLVDAYQSLTDIYSWQWDRNITHHPALPAQRLLAKGVGTGRRDQHPGCVWHLLQFL